MRALIDFDIFPYECGNLKKREFKKDEEDIFPDLEVGSLLPFEVCWKTVQSKIENIKEATNATKIEGFLSSSEFKSWRYDIATILPYKGQRELEKPPYWNLIRKNLLLNYNCKEYEFIEADDALSIEQCSVLQMGEEAYLPTVICSRDKDLNMVPGWHYSWPIGNQEPKEMWWQSPIGGLRCFYSQLLTGDSVDNILGLFRVGEKHALVASVKEANNESEMLAIVYKAYYERFRNYAKKFIIENGQLLWMMRKENERWNPWDGTKEDLLFKTEEILKESSNLKVVESLHNDIV